MEIYFTLLEWNIFLSIATTCIRALKMRFGTRILSTMQRYRYHSVLWIGIFFSILRQWFLRWIHVNSFFLNNNLIINKGKKVLFIINHNFKNLKNTNNVCDSNAQPKWQDTYRCHRAFFFSSFFFKRWHDIMYQWIVFV